MLPTDPAVRALEALVARGFDKARVMLTTTEHHELSAEFGHMNLLRTNHDTTLSLLGIVGDRQGRLTVNRTSDASIAEAVEDLWQVTQGSKPDPANDIAARQSPATFETGDEAPDRDAMFTRLAEVLDHAATHYPTLRMGQSVLLSSEQVFNGKWGNYKENSTPDPINNYGHSKLSAEAAVFLYDGKVVRLSRCVSKSDPDIQDILYTEKDVPTFIWRSYNHLDFAANAIFMFANRFYEMPKYMNYGSKDTISYYRFTTKLNENTRPRSRENLNSYPRPFRCGLNTRLAEKLGFQLHTIEETVDRILHE